VYIILTKKKTCVIIKLPHKIKHSLINITRSFQHEPWLVHLFMNYTTEKQKNQDVLSDKDKNGKERPWREHKIKSIEVSESFRRLGYIKKAESVASCGDTLVFASMSDGSKRLKNAWFCRNRLCSLCNWRRSRRIFAEVSQVMNVVEERHPELQPILLTLTKKNCDFDDLINEIGDILTGWKMLSNYKQVKSQVKGSFRALEVTYNIKSNEWHAHIHAILLFDESYFARRNKKYMTQGNWSELWRRAMKLDYDPIVDVRKINNNKGKEVAEVAKYTAKSSDYLKKDLELTDKLVSMLSRALHGRRLFQFGGVMKKIAKELDCSLDDGDLLKVDDDTNNHAVEMLEIKYRFHYAKKNYIQI